MNPIWLTYVAQTAIAVLALASILPLRRIIGGPSLADRSVGLDTLLANAIAILALFAIVHRSDRYLPTILLLILLGFTSAVCFARFLEAGQVFESEADTTPEDMQGPTEDALP